MEGHYRLFLVPVDDDGAISESFLEGTREACPRISRARPLDLAMARSLLLSELQVMNGVRERLRDLATVLPATADQDAIFDDQEPCDETSFLYSALEGAVRDTLPSAIEPLRRAATVTDDELRRDFLERQARYLAARTRRRP